MPEERKLVSVLFADTVGSTALGAEHDPDLVRATMGRYFERMRTIAERHGGTVEKFIGDGGAARHGSHRRWTNLVRETEAVVPGARPTADSRHQDERRAR